MPETTAAIVTSRLEKRYGSNVAVKGLDLEVRAGEVFGLLGPNGAGKTTTILMLLGLSEPTGGSARVLGLDPARQPLEVKQQVGYLPDNVGFYGNLSGRQNLDYTCRLNGLDPADVHSRVNHWLTRVGLTDVADERVERYSRGMRQRLGLADALVKDPRVLILDEPTASIDPVGVREMLDLVRGLAEEQGVTILLSSHLLDQVQEVCDRIAIFVEGEAVAMGTVPELAARQERGVTVTIEVGLNAEPERIRRVLEAVPGVTAVRLGGREQGTWLVSGPTEISDAVLHAVLEADMRPWLIRDHGMDLGDIYQRYFAPARPGSASVGQAHPAGAVS